MEAGSGLSLIHIYGNEILKKAKTSGAISEDDLKRGEKEIQQEHDKQIANINSHLAAKEAELLKV